MGELSCARNSALVLPEFVAPMTMYQGSTYTGLPFLRRLDLDSVSMALRQRARKSPSRLMPSSLPVTSETGFVARASRSRVDA